MRPQKKKGGGRGRGQHGRGAVRREGAPREFGERARLPDVTKARQSTEEVPTTRSSSSSAVRCGRGKTHFSRRQRVRGPSFSLFGTRPCAGRVSLSVSWLHKLHPSPARGAQERLEHRRVSLKNRPCAPWRASADATGVCRQHPRGTVLQKTRRSTRDGAPRARAQGGLAFERSPGGLRLGRTRPWERRRELDS